MSIFASKYDVSNFGLICSSYSLYVVFQSLLLLYYKLKLPSVKFCLLSVNYFLASYKERNLNSNKNCKKKKKLTHCKEQLEQSNKVKMYCFLNWRKVVDIQKPSFQTIYEDSCSSFSGVTEVDSTILVINLREIKRLPSL